MPQAAVPGDDRKAVSQLLEAIESAEYGAGIATDVPTMIDSAEGLVRRCAPSGTDRGSRLMHRIVPAVIALMFCTLTGEAIAADAATRQRKFLRALEVFDAAKTPLEYNESAALLESLLADGFRNGAVYYNMGNAYFRRGVRAGDRGVP